MKSKFYALNYENNICCEYLINENKSCRIMVPSETDKEAVFTYDFRCNLCENMFVERVV